MSHIKSFLSAIDEINNYLKYLSESGYTGFDCSKKSLAVIETWGKPGLFLHETLDEIQADLGDCRRCKLSDTRNNIVFGGGNQNAKLVFVGEGPGFEEDKQGVPFVGAAGELLTRIIQAINLTRENVYICNIIKCRPPGNRNPAPDEIEACLPFLQRQLKAIKPDYICTLGAFASRALLKTDKPISRLRGRFHDYMGIKLMPTYHPAYLLRNPEKKRDVWEDMKKLMKNLD